MEISSQKIDGLNGQIKIKVLKADYQEKLGIALKDLRKKADMKGFRKGMVPMGLIKKMYGTGALVEEINSLVSQKLFEHIYSEEYNILGEPIPSENQDSIDWENQEDFEFNFDIAYAPEIDFKNLENFKYPLYRIEPAEEDIIAKKENYQSNYGTIENQDVVADDSLIKIDLVELLNEGDEKEHAFTANSKSFLVSKIAQEAIKNELIGKKKLGDSFEINIREAFSNKTDLASMLGVNESQLENLNDLFSFTIQEITGYKKAEINQELFDKIYGENGISSEEEFTEKIKEEIARDYQYESEMKFTYDLREKITVDLQFDLPVEFLKRWLEKTDEKLTAEAIDRDWHLYEKDLKWQLIKDKIERDQNIEVSDEDMLEMAKNITLAQFRQYGFASLPENELLKFANQVLENEEQRKRITQSKKDEKIHNELKKMVPIETIDISMDDFIKMLQKERESFDQ